MRVDAVDFVVRGHDGHRSGLTHGDFKRGQINLAHRALIDHGVGGLATQLLAVDREVLRAGGNTIGLDAADQTCGHAAGHDGVFGIVLKIAAAQRIALDVQAWAEQHIHVQIVRFIAEGLTHLFGERRIP